LVLSFDYGDTLLLLLLLPLLHRRSVLLQEPVCSLITDSTHEIEEICTLSFFGAAATTVSTVLNSLPTFVCGNAFTSAAMRIAMVIDFVSIFAVFLFCYSIFSILL